MPKTKVSVANERGEQANWSSFQEFVLAHETLVFTFCYRMLGNAAIAEPAATAAFLDVWPHFPTVSLASVLAAARCHCHRQLKMSATIPQTKADSIQALFNRLPLPEREVMALHYGCHLNLLEIAAVLDSSYEAARVILWQALRLAAAHPSDPMFPLPNCAGLPAEIAGSAVRP